MSDVNLSPTLVVVTGGPGAGKTAVLEIARRNLSRSIAILPEAAGIVFGGGFWRHEGPAGRKAAQRAIYHVQRESERLVIDEGLSKFILCDRGTLDGLAYWPSDEGSFWSELRTSREEELLRYAHVIHLRTPSSENGYNHDNSLRIETPAQAREIDLRIEKAWSGHPSRFFVDSAEDFMEKAARAVALVRHCLSLAQSEARK